MNNNYLLISSVGPQEPRALNALTRRILEAGCNVEEGHVVALGQSLSAVFLVSGHWNAIAKLEGALGRWEHGESWQVSLHRTGARQDNGPAMPYAVEVVAADEEGILHQLAEFFAQREIRIEALMSSRYDAAKTGTPMLNVHITLSIPRQTHIAALREEFMEFCDGLNLDAVMEPIKS